MKRKFLPFIIVLAILNYGCLKDADFEKLSANLVVATNTAEGADFNSYKTYYISDTVAFISNDVTDTILNDANSQKLVEAMKQNMSSRGYTLVNKGQNPDLGIAMVVIQVNVDIIYSGWWGGYPGYWDPWYWGGYYPYYYPWAAYYTVSTGTVVAEIIDLKNAMTNSALKIIWASVMSGAVGDNIDANVQRGVTAINQAFEQTPELKTN